MNFEQFLKVLIKIAKLVFGDEDSEGDEKGKEF